MKHKDFEKAIEDCNESQILNGLLYFVEYDDDWEWIQDKCLSLLTYENVNVKGLAVTCIGHIARIHGKIDYVKVMKNLKLSLEDKSISGRIQDAIDDIEMFVTTN